MRPSEFTHLHVHSDASLIDGLGPVGRLVEGAAAKGFNTLALTDHGSFANAVLFTIACDARGIKPILGVEGYVEYDGTTGHITLLADGDEGFRNLVALNNRGHAGSGSKPSFTIDDLVNHAADVVCLTGCVASPFNNLSLGDATKLGARLKAAFGHRLFSEVMFVADTDTWTRPLQLADQLGIKPVITNDVHFPYREDADVHPILTSMKAGFTYNSRNLFLRTPAEIDSAAAGLSSIDHGALEAMMQRSAAVGRKIRRVNLKRDPKLPDIVNAHERLRIETVANLKAMHAKNPWPVKYLNEVVIPRVKYELDVIKTMGYSAYFVILSDIIDHAKMIGTRVGPGRGSGAGSLVLYLLGVTEVDPLKHDLSFERFLNPFRKGMPDVDVDFDSETRDRVIHYATERWGAVPVATYARYSHKTAVHDLAKVLRMPRDVEDTIADKGPECEEFARAKADIPNFGRSYTTILGQIRHRGKHAGGVVITDGVVPLERAGDIKVAAWTEGEDRELSYAGIVKFDLLGLTALSILRRLETQFGRRADDPTSGSGAFSIFKDGDLKGIFQFSGSQGILELTRKMQPDTFEDLVAINALYRPGALDVGSTDMYPEWKKKPRVVHTFMADILAPTYGAVVYQEQVMAIFARVTGGSLGEADLARRVIVKSKIGDPKWEAEMNALQDQFVAACIRNHGLSDREAEKLWHELASHSRYSFNKAHAVAYARISWDMAWWKWHHRAAFYTACLNVDPGESQSYTYDAVAHGIPVMPPNVNESTLEYVTDGTSIYMPLTAVKHLGHPGALAIVSARTANKFDSLDDFMTRVPKKVVRAKAREGLYELGAFVGMSCVDYHRKLGLKPDPSSPWEDESWYTKQQRYLGFVIPTVGTMRAIKAAQKAGEVAGIVERTKEKSSRYGKYTVYYLLPEGIFWSRTPVNVKIGDMVAARVNSKSGKALAVRKLGE